MGEGRKENRNLKGGLGVNKSMLDLHLQDEIEPSKQNYIKVSARVRPMLASEKTKDRILKVISDGGGKKMLELETS